MKHVSAVAAASHGGTSTPASARPKKTMNSCISSGVPWKTEIHVFAAAWIHGLCAIRANSTIRPTLPPSTNAAIARISVHSPAAIRLRAMSHSENSSSIAPLRQRADIDRAGRPTMKRWPYISSTRRRTIAIAR